MEESMSTNKIPQTDSIQELAKFWDEHDLTDFESELEQVADAVFERDTEVRIQLPSKEAEAIQSIAKTQGIDVEALIREWVLERVQASA